MPRVVDLPGASLLVHEWGDGAGEPLLFLHHLGVTGSGRHLAEAAPLLVEAGFRIVAPDLPGFGGSPAARPEAYDPEALADLAVGLLDALAIPRAAVVGFSWGGTLAVALAARHPERVGALVLLDAGHVDAQDEPDFEQELDLAGRVASAREGIRYFHYADHDELVRAGQARYRRWSPALEAAWVGAFDERDGELRPRLAPETFGAAYHGLSRRRTSDVLPALGRSGVPVLLVVASEPAESREQREHGAQRFCQLVPRAEVRHVEGPHDLVSELGPELAPLLVDWLRRR